MRSFLNGFVNVTHFIQLSKNEFHAPNFLPYYPHTEQVQTLLARTGWWPAGQG
jgi:hypothetical protein